MQLGMIGLGRMGANMVRRLMRGGHECVVFDMSAESVKKMAADGAAGAEALAPRRRVERQGHPSYRYRRDKWAWSAVTARCSAARQALLPGFSHRRKAGREKSMSWPSIQSKQILSASLLESWTLRSRRPSICFKIAVASSALDGARRSHRRIAARRNVAAS
jgi:hypothetical protein